MRFFAEMQFLCDRVCIIIEGKIAVIKTVDELIEMANSGGKAKLLLKTDNNTAASGLLDQIHIQQSTTDGRIYRNAASRRRRGLGNADKEQNQCQ
ncbi:MAG: hypothetical protein GX936_01060 [Clostridiales bacterium]|jgi:ABC-type multidrug transport system ATPase subunit|nr:hypothetical protein [Clostridiales bacterium]